MKNIKTSTGTQNAKLRIASLFLAAALGACGGGGDDAAAPAPTPAPAQTPAPGGSTTSAVSGILQISGDAERFGRTLVDASTFDATVEVNDPACTAGTCSYWFSMDLFEKSGVPYPKVTFGFSIASVTNALAPIGKDVTGSEIFFGVVAVSGSADPGEIYLAGCLVACASPVDAATAYGITIDPVKRQVTFTNMAVRSGEASGAITFINGTLTY